MSQRRVPEGCLLRASRPLALAIVLIACARIVCAQPPGQFTNWKFDSLHKKNGKTLLGLVEGESGAEISFAYILHSPGKQTAIFHTNIPKAEIARIDRLGSTERAQLQARLATLLKEKTLPKDLDVKPAPWGKERTAGFSYTSSRFVLLSNAREDIVRSAAAGLEQIYGAYERFLPPRRPHAPLTQILLVQPLGAYHEMLKEQGRDLANPAFYDPARNQIVWGCELQRLEEELEQEREKIRQRSKLHKGALPPELRRRLDDDLKQLEKTKSDNERIYDRSKQAFFQVLYHEAFHAYLANYVFSHDQGELPRWLNEGLAQIFETALVEAGELEISRPDAERLTRAKDAERKGELVKLDDLLRSGPRDFLVGHAGDQEASNRTYLTSWALAFYLTFERKKIDLPELDQYVQTLRNGNDSRKAFENLVGQALPDFEKCFHEYVQQLRVDGSLLKVAPAKQANSQQ